LQVAIPVLWFHSNSPFLTIQFLFRANHDNIIRSPYLIPLIGSPHMPTPSRYQKHEMECGFNHAEPDVQKFLFGFNSKVQIFQNYSSEVTHAFCVFLGQIRRKSIAHTVKTATGNSLRATALGMK
jgi:hypothetical protein